MFDRFIELVGQSTFEKIKNKKILIVGIGGVGGSVVESLVRCGVETVVLVDPDIVDRTNINRQMIAMSSTIGRKKVEVWKERILDISSQCNCVIVDDKIGKDHIENIQDLQKALSIEFDFIVDCCDDLNAKKKMIQECLENHLPFISSMGTGKRLDPSKLEITTLDKTSYDPIAKILRKFVRDEHLKGKVPVLVSKEQPLHTNSKVIPSCSFVPTSAGLLIASYIIRQFIEK